MGNGFRSVTRAFHVLLTVFLLILGGLISGCGSSETRVESGNRTGVFHVGNATEPQSLDPHVSTGVPEHHIQLAIFEGLVSKHPTTLEPVPGVAERWEVGEDRLTYRFYIRENARWSNGDLMTAEDYRWSWERALTPAMGNQYAYMLYPIKNAEAFATGKIGDFSQVGVKVISPQILEVTLNNPTPYFLQLLDHHSAYAVHRPSIEKHGSPTARYSDWTRPGNLVGNGPFKLTEWKLYRHIRVEKNEHYWDAENVALNAIMFYPTENLTTEERMFRVGQLHMTKYIPLDKAPVYRENDPDSFVNERYLGTYYYQFNLSREPFKNVKVRQALAFAIDRDALIKTVLNSSVTAAYSLTPPGTLGYQPPKLVGFDPNKARKLLAEAGFPNGEGFPVIELLYNTSEQHRKVAVAVQQMWKDHLNINVNIVNQEWKVYLSSRDQLQYDIARAAWIGDFVDPMNFLDLGLSDNGNNRSAYSDPHYDYLIKEYIPSATTPKERLERFFEAETYLMEAMPFVPIYTYHTMFLRDKGVKGLPANLMDYYSYKHVTLGNDEVADNAVTEED
ncbi:peptide ABC transporter substrate-binding protein [Marinibactrum halimedae]|uniref:ABC transporter permease n=1 Tax=Marinibactrum halimedae TaxID=1444977 RepID=A0AA37T5G3_9GAMM|nr:peptide ABC transporter substrate-binding protein [Marinibactrum halimedae]MCD9457391.1 peptide ABC transporter substrate-binding protein [Marinibactrum halimedae]GLS25558.1 ABC transporter permease [Marinibactrum halimedae]